MTEQWLLVAFVIALVATFWYLGECLIFLHHLEINHHAQWVALGSPSIRDVRSFASYTKVLLGISPLGQELSGYAHQLLRIRALLAVGLIAYTVVSVYQAIHAD